ncbi:hypothetical protein V5H98_04130 [Georgenia sp. M64]|jgi:hypothetical protein|uniref:hypothetical protein n=1 Tax=Georgenia sp. M64 TaxID=3120520 RepID=UPI0030E1D4EC
MSTERADDVEHDPDIDGQEHVVDTDPARAPEEYAPEVEVDEPTREAEPADVAEQLIEVPVPEDEESDAAEPAEY